MHRPLLLLTTMILGVAAIAVTVFSASLQPPSPIEASDSADVTTVLSYYDAVNKMIATGDPTDLRDVVHPEMIDLIPPPSGPAGREGIEHYLGYLHTVAPEARVEAGPVTGTSGRAIAQVAVRQRSSLLPLGFAAAGPLTVWPAFERFRVDGGQIIERHFSWEGLVILDAISEIPFSIEIPAGRTLEVTLSAYDPRSNGAFVTGDIPAILRLESGSITFSLSQAASGSALVLSSLFNEGPKTPERVLPGTTRKSGPGDVLVVPPNSAYTVLNLWPDPALVLRVSVAVPSVTGPQKDTSTEPQQHGIADQSLLSPKTIQMEAPTLLSLEIALMMPGNRLTVDPATILIVVWADSGDIHVDMQRPACAGAVAGDSNPFENDQQLANLWLHCPDETTDSVVMNTGNEPATAWIIAVTATPHTS